MNLKHSIMIVAISGLVALATAALYVELADRSSEKRIGIVDSKRLIASFEGTREAVSMLGANNESELEQPVQESAAGYSDSYSVLSDPRVMEPLFKTINRLIQEYGNEQGYDVIFGSTDDGSVLYGGGTTDITDELITYMNQKYREN